MMRKRSHSQILQETRKFNQELIMSNKRKELLFLQITSLRADVSKYRPEDYKSEKTKILKKIHKVALGKLLT